MGLEYSPLCDRHNTMVPQSQIGKKLSNHWISYQLQKMIGFESNFIDCLLHTSPIQYFTNPYLIVFYVT